MTSIKCIFRSYKISMPKFFTKKNGYSADTIHRVRKPINNSSMYTLQHKHFFYSLTLSNEKSFVRYDCHQTVIHYQLANLAYAFCSLKVNRHRTRIKVIKKWKTVRYIHRIYFILNCYKEYLFTSNNSEMDIWNSKKIIVIKHCYLHMQKNGKAL